MIVLWCASVCVCYKNTKKIKYNNNVIHAVIHCHLYDKGVDDDEKKCSKRQQNTIYQKHSTLTQICENKWDKYSSLKYVFVLMYSVVFVLLEDCGNF